ncbi:MULTISPECIES: hypothetical protein [unclassified Saccharopolyspora]|uniref:hypothetical protein n=1 Tax=unclassified Saccharopolyspora TaxID=2646250 RepID=UPI001CD2DF3E|nr:MULTISPECIES: hypothetical protein [unclassified Saccharopolyspora]MCA1188737.1 hypothetical protein [Saccharopolyspora sp. 6T]MCA1192100.1 hypothetical protein [Saccharopolyspora sp. 6V]MCA1226128.1 hypothetical protein [Saccharopolyspora sp. 6M]MCA1280261.1 hypothetical protein [Saccharopolyspora sp. 7B]
MRLVESPQRGKGSHRLFLLCDEDDRELVRFVLPGHQREVSWTVLRSIEGRLAPLLGEKWMEER